MRASELSASEVCSVAAVSALSARHFDADLTLQTVSGQGQAARPIRLQKLASLKKQMHKRHDSASAEVQTADAALAQQLLSVRVPPQGRHYAVRVCYMLAFGSS